MPTENRSSNTEVASVPKLLAADNDRDMLEYLSEGYASQVYVCEQCSHEEPLQTYDLASDLRDYLAAYPNAPAQQHQGEPVRMVSAGQKGAGLWLEVAGKSLEECVAFPEEHEFREFYAHADTAEVERLRADIETMRRKNNEYWHETEVLRAHLGIETARAAERDALLAETRTLLHKVTALGGRKIGTLYSHTLHMCHRIDAILSTSAEPKCGHPACKSLGEPHPLCDFAQAVEPRAPVESCERSDFDAAVLKIWGPCTKDILFMCGASLWTIWQARAALERKTSPHIPEGYCIMPRKLTAENGAKALLLGEFKLEVTRECPECAELEEPAEGCEICDGEGEYGQRHVIPWDKIKFIYSEAVKGLAIKQ